MSQRVRSGRASTEQYNKMLDFFVLNKGLAEGKFTAIHGRLEASRKWEELARILNTLQGAQKSAAQWQVAWRDLKSHTSVKARERRKEMAATGNNPLTKAPLSDLDKKVLSLLGTEYVEGSSRCGENIAEEDNAQIALEAGDISVLLGYPAAEIPVDSRAEVIPPTIILPDTPLPNVPDTPTCEPSTSKPKRVAKRKAVYDGARDNFFKIAKQQADAMMMQAEAAKTQAEAAKTQAEATLLQAQAFDRVATALESLAKSVCSSKQ